MISLLWGSEKLKVVGREFRLWGTETCLQAAVLNRNHKGSRKKHATNQQHKPPGPLLKVLQEHLMFLAGTSSCGGIPGWEEQGPSSWRPQDIQ